HTKNGYTNSKYKHHGQQVYIIFQKLIDDILPNNETAKLMAGLGLLLFLLIVRGGLNYVRQLFLVTQSQDFNNRIINHFYGSLMYLPKSFFDNRKIGELVARMNDTSRIQSALAYITANLLIDVLLVLVAAAFIFSYSVYLGIASLMVIPVYFLLVFLFHDSIVRSQRELMVSYASNESNYVDTIDGIGEIKVANKEELFTNITKHIYGIFQSSVFNLGRVRIRFTFATEIVGTIIIVAVLSWSSYLVLQEVLLIGEMMAILQFIGMMLPAAGRMATINIQLQEARVAFDRMFEFTMIHPEYVKEEDDRKEPLHEFSDLKVDKLSF
ncbi:MAG: peptidase domain-containing ABC transporter, partial [Bacteroidetes bacterium]|nr:peptidase domain-containing ABC transporter [Bacteroidota bacterium]